MKYRQWLVILLWAAILATPAVADVIGKSDQEVRTAADPILDSLLEGFNKGDYALYAKNFDDTLKEAVPEKKFKQVREQLFKQMGRYKSRTYLGYLTKGKTTVALWRGTFDQTDGDVLIKMVLSRRGDRNLVLGLWFE